MEDFYTFQLARLLMTKNRTFRIIFIEESCNHEKFKRCQQPFCYLVTLFFEKSEQSGFTQIERIAKKNKRNI